MIRGTRIIEGEEAKKYRKIVTALSQIALDFGYEEIILPSLKEPETFTAKAGPEITDQMWVFKDKGDRDVCLIPEATAIVQEWHNPRSMGLQKVFYVQRCYRYERPQAGRYREFTQFGVEILGQDISIDQIEALAVRMVETLNIPYEFKRGVKRGLHYYTAEGFEVECPSLGAQKQVCGGGPYDGGAGFAFGVDRLILAEALKT